MEELSLIPITLEYGISTGIVTIDTNVDNAVEYVNYTECLANPEFAIFIESLYHLFAHISIDEIDFSRYDFRNVTIFDSMFLNADIERVVGLSCSEKATDLRQLFLKCRHLKYFDCSKLNTRNVIYFYSMFAWCWNLEELDISNFDFSSAEYCQSMFEECQMMSDLFLPELTFKKRCTYDGMFTNVRRAAIHAGDNWNIIISESDG